MLEAALEAKDATISRLEVLYFSWSLRQRQMAVHRAEECKFQLGYYRYHLMMMKARAHSSCAMWRLSATLLQAEAGSRTQAHEMQLGQLQESCHAKVKSLRVAHSQQLDRQASAARTEVGVCPCFNHLR